MGANAICFGKLRKGYKIPSRLEFQVDLPILDKDLQNTDHPTYKKEKGPWTFVKKESNLLKGNCLITIEIQKESYIIDTIFTLSHSLKAKEYFDCIQHLFLKIESLIGDSKELVIIDSYAYIETGCCFDNSFETKIKLLEEHNFVSCSNYEDFKDRPSDGEFGFGYPFYLKTKVK
tara:strand:+ start:45 stop:569 length:525 start_codon:yes stop_codon:yes gene_type:complete